MLDGQGMALVPSVVVRAARFVAACHYGALRRDPGPRGSTGYRAKLAVCLDDIGRESMVGQNAIGTVMLSGLYSDWPVGRISCPPKARHPSMPLFATGPLGPAAVICYESPIRTDLRPPALRGPSWS